MNLPKIITIANVVAVILMKFWIIPEHINKPNQNSISSIVTFISACISLLVNINATGFNYINMIYITIFILIISIDVAGIYWWIPTYVPKQRQDETTRYLILGTSILLMVSSVFETSTLSQNSSATSVITSSVSLGGKRR